MVMTVLIMINDNDYNNNDDVDDDSDDDDYDKTSDLFFPACHLTRLCTASRAEGLVVVYLLSLHLHLLAPLMMIM